MYMTGFVGIIISTSCLAAMTARYSGTTNKVGNGFGIFFIYLYLAFQGYAIPLQRTDTTELKKLTFPQYFL